jgi:hypothetical protein
MRAIHIAHHCAEIHCARAGRLWFLTRSDAADRTDYRIGAALIASGRTFIDLASYSLTGPVVINALNDAQRRAE